MVHDDGMTHVPLSEAKGRLAELVRRAEAGEEVVVTRNGREVVRLQPVTRRQTAQERAQIIKRAQDMARGKLPPDFDAARSQDFLYDEDGLPA